MAALAGHLGVAGLAAWPAWQSLQQEEVNARQARREAQTLRERADALAPLEETAGPAFTAFKETQQLDPSARLQKLAAALTEWSDLTEVDLTKLLSLDNTESRLAVQTELKGSSRGIFAWLSFLDHSTPPIHVLRVGMKRVAAHVEATVELEAAPALRFAPPAQAEQPGWKLDPFRKDP